ncbi:MAG: GPR endopeptidase [Lachnospiraceae bacterium]|nr:GPR endopeptidase [Lachnospiraceae bacterium]
MTVRTDLAVEEKERFPGDGGEIKGVALREWHERARQIKITEVKILNDQGAKVMAKDKGTYLTMEAKDLEQKGTDFFEVLAEELAGQIGRLAGTDGKPLKEMRLLVVGLGNLYVTPDSLGPRVLEHLQVTRHYDGQFGEGFLKKHKMASISGIAPGVMAQTGMETAEILKGVVKETRPELVIAIDALAARSIRRLGCTIQISDTGIRPGSGVGNHRSGLTKESLGVPVLAVGVPTVVGAAAIVQDTMEAMVKVLESGVHTKGAGRYLGGLEPESQYALIRELLEPEFGSMFVTPPDIEERVEQLGKAISRAIELAFLR